MSSLRTPHHTGDLWATSVLLPADDRHEESAQEVVAAILAAKEHLKGIGKSQIDSYRAAAAWLIEVLYQSMSCIPEVQAILPRTPSMYSRNRVHAPPYGYDVVMRVVDAMSALGWVHETRGTFDFVVGAGHMTRISAAGALRDRLSDGVRRWVSRVATDGDRLILMGSGKHRRIVTADEGPDVARWQSNLHQLNEFLLSRCIRLEMQDAALLRLAALAGTKQAAKRDEASPEHTGFINFGSVEMRRIFAQDSLARGGRFYRGWWQHIPSEHRQRIVIDHDATAECDFSAMALTCLYARIGASPGDTDLYDVGLEAATREPGRSIVKKYINAVLNDTSGKFRLEPQELRTLGTSAQNLRSRVLQRHPQLEPYFHSGVGLELQFTDSVIAEAVMLRFMERGEVCLPIHDSFIVARRLRDVLKEIMLEEFERVTGVSGKAKLDPIRWALLPQSDAASFSELPDRLETIFEGREIVQEYYASWCEQNVDEHEHRGLNERGGCWLEDSLRGPPPDVIRDRVMQLVQQHGANTPALRAALEQELRPSRMGWLREVVDSGAFFGSKANDRDPVSDSD